MSINTSRKRNNLGYILYCKNNLHTDQTQVLVSLTKESKTFFIKLYLNLKLLLSS